MTAQRYAPLIYVTVRDIVGNEERVTEATNRIKKLEYTDSLKQADKCELTVDNFDLSNFDDPIWAHGNFVRVSWGYPGNMSLARELVITKVKGFTDLKVEARAKSVLIDAVKKSRTFKNMTRSEVVAKIAKEYGYNTETMQIDDSSSRLGHITQAGLSDAQFIKKLAHQQGFEFYVDQDGFHFHPMRLRQVPLREFIWYSDPGRGDVLSLSVEADVTRKKAEITKKAKDPVTKKTEEHTASNQVTERDGLAYITLMTSPDMKEHYGFRKWRREEFMFDPPQTSKHNQFSGRPDYLYRPAELSMNMCVGVGKVEAEAKFKQEQMSAVKVTMTAIGDPTLLGKSLVQLSNVGKRLSGSYYVTDVTHTVEPGGYVMKLKMRSDGLGPAAKKTTALSDGIPEVMHEKSKAKRPEQPTAACVSGRQDLLYRSDAPAVQTSKSPPRPPYLFHDNLPLEALPVVNSQGKQVATSYREQPKICDVPAPTKVVRIDVGKDMRRAKIVESTRAKAEQEIIDAREAAAKKAGKER